MDFIFIYKYNNKLRTSRNFQYEDGFNIKINRVIKIPQSYYNDQNGNRFNYEFFWNNNPKNMHEYLINEINNFIHNDIPIENLSDLINNN